MIGIYTYSLIFIALALMFACMGAIKVVLFAGAGLQACSYTGAFLPTGISRYASQSRLRVRNPFTATALYAAVGSCLSTVFIHFLPTATIQRKITVTTPGFENRYGDSHLHSFNQPVCSKFKSMN